MTSAAAGGQFVISHYLAQSLRNRFKMIYVPKYKSGRWSKLVSVGLGGRSRAQASWVIFS